MNGESTNLKLVVVGDGGVGKSSLLITYTTGTFPSEYVPTVFDNYCFGKMKNGKQYNMALWDTAGQEDYDRLRPLAYPSTNVFLVCFDLANRDSFENISCNWIPELTRFCPDAPRILVGCKKDLTSQREVQTEEARRLALDLRCVKYVETSSLNSEGLNQLFDLALNAAIAHQEMTLKVKKRSIFKSKKKSRKMLITAIPPVMPPAGFAPEIEIETSTIVEDWLALFNNSTHADTTLVLSNGQEVDTHRIFLVNAPCFRDALGMGKMSKKELPPKKYSCPPSYNNHPVIVKVESCDGPQSTRIYLSEDVKPQVLTHALQFFYAGVVEFDGWPGKELLREIKEMSDMFSSPFLKSICKNIENDEEELNPSIGTYLCDLRAEAMKQLFFNRKASADVQFIFKDREIYAHRCILCARNKTMSAMFDGRFAEGCTEKVTTVDMRKDNQIESDAFLVLLEYLYTGHAPLDKGVDPVSILIVADRYNVTRLTNLCELYITKVIDKMCYKSIEKADVDIIGLLGMAHFYNATQLSGWCLHFISTNYLPLSVRPEWNQLSSKDLQHIEEHRWPPVDYLNQVKEYEEEMQQRTKTDTSTPAPRIMCSIM